MFHFIKGLLFGSTAFFTCKGEFQCTKRDHLAFAMIKSHKLGVVFAFFNFAACVQCFVFILRWHPAAFLNKYRFYLVPIVGASGYFIKIKVNKGRYISGAGGMLLLKGGSNSGTA